ncbi:hypothetical protein Pmar_PMAR017356 [Perkinsus marinus ATCC 50983]|uniref:Uncharacterized protein n=1 Tax=Perkinsus marinus (strain ATCC 50983 / TXsc) TaxID=423536 RepID=C5LHD2_PERM5|nr:hypothetical protein Pmar_PMAR017356 [Perkinsus marinus ATCC 50983]EER03941.1 hypothetical protein Pmar_PMAR017356 [Perkinsus marinus ATCC 50983]|eukprot:XP_002772125.1 hypothetical protein Pmar_PMAR017356 [Perkinsus marinus ATCC 50983]
MERSFITSLHGRLLSTEDPQSNGDDLVVSAIRGFTNLSFEARRKIFESSYSDLGEFRLTYIWLMSVLLDLPFARKRALWALNEMTDSPWDGVEIEEDGRGRDILCEALWRLVHSSAYGELATRWDWQGVLEKLAVKSLVAAQALETVKGTAELGRKPLIRSLDELAIGGTDGGCGECQVEAADLTEGQRKAVNDL